MNLQSSGSLPRYGEQMKRREKRKKRHFSYHFLRVTVEGLKLFLDGLDARLEGVGSAVVFECRTHSQGY